MSTDYYPTPDYSFKPLIKYLPKDIPIWEPACGDKRLIKWMKEENLEADGADLLDSKPYNFLDDFKIYQCIVTNPPFSLAFDFCKHAVNICPEVFFLLRLNFLASKKRKFWFINNTPSALFILSKRPSFDGSGGTDMTDYAWYYWGKRYNKIYFI